MKTRKGKDVGGTKFRSSQKKRLPGIFRRIERLLFRKSYEGKISQRNTRKAKGEQQQNFPLQKSFKGVSKFAKMHTSAKNEVAKNKFNMKMIAQSKNCIQSRYFFEREKK